MKKIISFCDIHGNIHNLMKLVPALEKCDLAIFLGDGLATLECLPNHVNKKLFVVKGNCDIFAHAAYDMLMEIDGINFFITHGHVYGAKGGVDSLYRAAKEEGASVVLYGHVHQYLDNNRDGVRLIGCPPLGTSRTNEGGSYLELDVKNGKIDVRHKRV